MFHFKGIYGILLQILKCRKSCVFGANFLAKTAAGARFLAFCNYD